MSIKVGIPESSSEEEEVLDLSGDSHTIVKILEIDGSYSLEVIDTFDAVTSQYFETDKFQFLMMLNLKMKYRIIG